MHVYTECIRTPWNLAIVSAAVSAFRDHQKRRHRTSAAAIPIQGHSIGYSFRGYRYLFLCYYSDQLKPLTYRLHEMKSLLHVQNYRMSRIITEPAVALAESSTRAACTSFSRRPRKRTTAPRVRQCTSPKPKSALYTYRIRKLKKKSIITHKTSKNQIYKQRHVVKGPRKPGEIHSLYKHSFNTRLL